MEDNLTGELTVDQRIKLEGIAREIRSSHLRAGLELINVGRALVEAREILFGGFTRWLEDELDMSPRLAQHFMNIADRFGSVPKLISGVPLTVLYSLAAPSTSEKVINAVFERVQNGEDVKVKDVKALQASQRPAGKTHQAVADAAEQIRDELLATGGHVAVDGESIEGALTEAAAEAIRPDNELLARKLDAEDGVEGHTRHKGRCVVDYVDRGGRVTLYAPELTGKLRKGMRVTYLLWVDPDQDYLFNDPRSLPLVDIASEREHYSR